jgi:hypothetical protein
MASKKSKVFHKASCHNTANISEKNKVGFVLFADAIGTGKKPAKCCSPTK